MMTTRRTRPALAAGLLAASLVAQAQSDLAGPGSFSRQTQSELQSQRTARLLAASQQVQPPVVPAYVPVLPTSRAVLPYATTSTTAGAPVRVVPLAESPLPPPAPPQSPVVYRGPTYASAPTATGVIPPMPAAIPGECFALVRTPEKYRSTEQEYEVRSASERIETIPPRYEVVTEEYVAQEAFERLEVVPARFRMVTEKVETVAPTVRYTATEPVYETVTERILESPARSVWKKGTGPIQRVDNATGEIMCLVEEPAVYRNITRRVLKTPAQAVEVPVPGQYSLVNRTVLDSPAEVRRVVVPEKIGLRNVRRQIDTGGVRRVPVPAVTAVTTVRELVEPARLEWRSVLCETNMRPENIRRVQGALLREGFNPGPVTGSLNTQTMAALNSYQRARNLPEDQYLNMVTVRALGAL